MNGCYTGHGKFELHISRKELIHLLASTTKLARTPPDTMTHSDIEQLLYLRDELAMLLANRDKSYLKYIERLIGG